MAAILSLPQCPNKGVSNEVCHTRDMLINTIPKVVQPNMSEIIELGAKYLLSCATEKNQRNFWPRMVDLFRK